MISMKEVLVKAWRDGVFAEIERPDLHPEVVARVFVTSKTAQDVPKMPEFFFFEEGIRTWVVPANRVAPGDMSIQAIDLNNYIVIVSHAWDRDKHLPDMINAIRGGQMALMGGKPDSDAPLN